MQKVKMEVMKKTTTTITTMMIMARAVKEEEEERWGEAKEEERAKEVLTMIITIITPHMLQNGHQKLPVPLTHPNNILSLTLLDSKEGIA